MREGEFSKGYYCEPTVVDNVPQSHPLWQHEMFLPITMIAGVKSFDQAMELANGVDFGLTAGMYGNKKEARAFYQQTQAGVNYVNRPQGATTGAWPGFQPFGGWKSSGATSKLAGGLYYLPMFMHEQIHNMVE
jgi:1-pyrroline-5-carboxylate dehydrogenase